LNLFLKIFSFTIFVLLISGCAIPAYTPPPQVAGQPMDVAEAELVVARLIKDEDELRSYRGLSQSTFTQEAQTDVLRHLLAFKKPDRLRVEALPPNAVYTLNLLVTKDGEYTFVDAIERSAARGVLTEDLFYSMFRLRANEQQFMNFFTGRVPPELLGGWIGRGGIQVYRNPVLEQIEIVKGDFQFHWILDSTTLNVKRFRARDLFTARDLFEINYSDYQSVGEIQVPATVNLYVPIENTRINMNFSSITVNQDYSESLFQTTIPADYSVRE